MSRRKKAKTYGQRQPGPRSSLRPEARSGHADAQVKKFNELASPVKVTFVCICPRDGCRADVHVG